jgi:hypothetical protein
MGVFHGDFGPVDVRVGGAAPSGTFTNFGPARVSAFSTAGISSDFNNNGAVDAADYVLWRNAGLLHNDLTPGVQPQDYETWRAKFSQVGDVASAYSCFSRELRQSAKIWHLHHARRAAHHDRKGGRLDASHGISHCARVP